MRAMLQQSMRTR